MHSCCSGIGVKNYITVIPDDRILCGCRVIIIPDDMILCVSKSYKDMILSKSELYVC